MTFPRSLDPRLMTLAVAGLSLANVQAVGFRLPNQDPEAIARGNAFVATADNPSAIFYNPAGITQLEGQQLSIGVYAISADIHYTAYSGTFAGGTASTDPTVQFIPQIYYTYSPADSPWSFGLGVYAPYGLGVDYGNVSPISTIAQEAKLLYATANPVVAYQISPTLSVAAGVTLNYSDVNLQRQIAAPADGFRFDGDGYDTGFNLGLLWHPLEEWAFGLNYRSATEIKYDGRSIAFPYSGGYSDTSASIVFPQNIVAGVSYRPNDKWNFEVDLDWTDWDAVNDSTFVGTFGGPQVFPFRYTSGLMYEFGVTRNLEHGYFVSAGYIYSENSVPDETLTPFNPDSNLQLCSIGFGHHGDCVSWALGYHFAYNGGRNVVGSGSVSPIGQTADGHYTTFNNAVNVSVKYAF